jgi:hypothetical protein
MGSEERMMTGTLFSLFCELRPVIEILTEKTEQPA